MPERPLHARGMGVTYSSADGQRGGRVSRRESHYRALYASWLAAHEMIFPTAASLRLHELLLEP